MRLQEIKLFIFTDGSFASNKDCTFQLEYLIILAMDDSLRIPSFYLKENIVHWASTKCKQVTRSILASELYGMTTGYDAGIAISTTLTRITNVLQIARIPTILCTDSKSLYECLVKLGSTTEKRLMIDILVLGESYEKKEISEIRWIEGRDNPADAFTKGYPNEALRTVVSTNCLTVRIEAFVERK